MSKYSFEFKLKVVEEYLGGETGGCESIAKKYDIKNLKEEKINGHMASSYIIRDLLSQRKLILLRENIYMFWIFLIGIIMEVKGQEVIAYKYLLFIVFSTLGILSFVYGWKIPYRNY